MTAEHNDSILRRTFVPNQASVHASVCRTSALARAGVLRFYLAAVLTCTAASSAWGQMDAGNTPPDAAALPLGQREWHDVNAVRDSADWFICEFTEVGKLQAMVECPAKVVASQVEWTLYAAGDNAGELGAAVDAGRVEQRRFSLWIPASGGRYYLVVQAVGQADMELAYRVGFDFQLAPRDQAGNLLPLPTATEDTTPTRFRDSNFNDTSAVTSTEILFDAKLERDTLFNYDIEGEYVYFQIYRNGTWSTLPEDGITNTSHWTDGNGISKCAYVLPPDLNSGVYPMRAKYNGSSEYGACSRQINFTVQVASSTLRERTAHVVGSGRIPLIMIHGNGGEGDPEGPWAPLLDYLRDHPTECPSLDPYVWIHNTSRAIGFNGWTGNASELANIVNNHVLPDYPPGTKVVLIAHSRGGMVSRAFMNYADRGDKVGGLVTLATPHHGSPFAVPDWAAISWGLRIGTTVDSRTAFDMVVGPSGKGFDIDRLGSLNLAWDNMDSVVQGSVTLPMGISFAIDGGVKLSYRDMNHATSFSDETVLYSDLAKSQYGTLDDLNNREAYYDRIITYAAYDTDLSDNPNWNNILDVLWNAVNTLLSDHTALAGITQLLAYMSDQVSFNSSNYVANDGMVPLQSALLLDMSGGPAFATKNANGQVTLDWNTINSRQQASKYVVWSGGIKDHLDVVATTDTSYWASVVADLCDSAKRASCLAPPEYNYYISPGETWSTTASLNVIDDGCRIYKMFLWDDTAYDFSLCGNDGVGSSTPTGDGDLEMMSSTGQTLWTIDGQGGCSWDASTLGTGYEGWTPPTTGYYYLRVSEFFDNSLNYKLAYKGRIKRGDLTVNIQPAAAAAQGAQWRLEGGDWLDSGVQMAQLWISNYTIEFKPIDGWLTPANAMATILDGQLTQITGEYLADCNLNGVADVVEITQGAADCDQDQTLDICEADSDGDGTIDGCDRCLGFDDRIDADGDLTPDACDQCPETLPGVPVDATGCATLVSADVSRDGDVDLEDLGLLQRCVSGTGVPQTDAACQHMHLAGHEWIDSEDVLMLQFCLSGANVPAYPNCMPY